MKKIFLTIFAVCMCLSVFPANTEGKVKINIILKAQPDAMELNRMANAFQTKAERRLFVVNSLKNHAKESQSDLLNLLNELETNGLVEDVRPLWIVNSVNCFANGYAIDEIAKRDDVLTVCQIEEFQFIESEDVNIPAERTGGREIAENVTKVNADKVWELGYTGEGVLVGLIDTGADYPNHGYGTHVAGTIALMLSKDHELTPELIDEILEGTAVPLSSHKSNDFGSGRIDALAAVQAIDNYSVSEIENDGFVVYPNPANDVIYIKSFPADTRFIASHNNDILSVAVYSIDGKLIKNCVTNPNQIRTDDLEHGVYILKISAATGVAFRKIIVS